MEKEIAIIRPKGLTHNAEGRVLPAAYGKNGRDYSLSRHGEVYEGVSEDSTGDIRFNHISTEHRITRLGKDQEAVDAEIKFWLDHPMVEDVNGESKGSALYTIEIVAKTKAKKRAKTENVNKVISSVYQMTAAQRKDVMYFFKQDPREMNDEDIILLLVDFGSGLLIQEPNTSIFIDSFCGVTRKDKKDRVDMMIYVNKGISTGFVSEDADKFYIGDVLIGKDEDDITLFFKDNPQMYDNLVRSLSKAGDDSASDDMKKVASGTTIVDVPEATKVKFEKLFKQYKMKGAMPKTFEKLREKINNFEEEEGLDVTEV